MDKIASIMSRFFPERECADVREIPTGNINRTYRVTYRLPDGGEEKYLLQCLNTYVFRNPEGVMNNIRLVTGHIADNYESRGIDSSRRVLHVFPTTDGAFYIPDDELDGCWRLYNYIDHAVTFDRSENPAQFQEAGRAFGSFARLLTDLPGTALTETIPDFHNTPKRFEVFLDAVRADKAGRVKGLGPEIAFFLERQKDMGSIVSGMEAGEIPVRVTHNDTKINNVMMDETTGRAVCIIDLDTVMPGSILYDYGDAIRSGASAVAEDDPDFSHVKLDLELFEAFTKGYLEELSSVLTPKELEMLPLSVKIISSELAMRFLTDYVDGDLYFKTDYTDHNLVRARNQMTLVRDIEAKMPQMEAICRRYR